MPKRDKLETANIVKASTEGQHFVVTSAQDPNTVGPNVQTQVYECACHTKFTSIAGMSPFCIQCGSDDVEPVQESDTELEFPDSSELSTLCCPNCGVFSIMKDQTATLLNGRTHCTACGEEILYVTAQDDEFLEEIDDAGSQEADDSSQEDDDDQQEDQQEDQQDDQQEGQEPTGEQQQDAGKCVKSEPDFAQDEIEMSMLDCVKGGDVNLITANDSIWAMVSGVPVAVLHREKAGDNQDIFVKRAFSEAITATVAKLGLKKGLEAYAFEPIVAKFPFAKQVTAKAETAMVDGQKQIASQLTTLRDDYRQCLSLAAVGLTKNFFRGKDHPLKAAFYEELSSAGVRNPVKIIDKVFANFGDSYHKALFEVADDLMSKPLDIRNQMATTLGQVTMAEVDADEAEDEADQVDAEPMTLASRLASPVLSIEEDRKQTTASVRELRQATGGSFFKRA